MSRPAEIKDLTRVVARGVTLSSAGLILTQVLNLAIYIVLARLASPEVFGMFAAASILAAIGELVSESASTVLFGYASRMPSRMRLQSQSLMPSAEIQLCSYQGV